MVEAFVVSSGGVGVVKINESLILKKDFFAVGIFKLRIIVDIELDFPLLELS